MLAWKLVFVVCTKHEVMVLQPCSETAPDLGSVTLIITTYCSHLPSHLFQPFLDFLFPTIALTPIAPPSSTRQLRFTLSLHLLLPLNSPWRGVTVHLDGASTRRLPTLLYASIPILEATRSSSRKPVTAIPYPLAPPSPSSTYDQVPVRPRGSPV